MVAPTAMLLLAVVACLWRLCNGYIEVVEESGSSEREFRLTCRHLEAHMAILEAKFTAHEEPWPGNISTIHFYQDDEEPYPVRLALNHRCSGVNHCSFILHADCPGSKYWGHGDVYIKYACMTVRRITKYCNIEVVLPEGGGPKAQGFISTPGYPKFYVGQSECRWRIRAPADQKIQLTLLDVSLSVHVKYEGACEDELIVRDGSANLLSTCQEREKPPVVVSTTDVLYAAVKGRTGSLVPKRGVLIHYKAIGCPSVPAPKDGYLVYRNNTHAHYMCCVGFELPGSKERAVTLTCLENAWDKALSTHCAKINVKNTTYVTDVVKDKNHKMTDTNFMSDILIPSIIMAGLLLGNAIIVFIIYKYRKRKTAEPVEEELGTMVSHT